jgi:two-component system, OmpR family, phosphate regulon sensor histidine kinase PhoR
LSVEVFESADNHRVVIIKDTGIGMNEDAQMHIFERFYKADKSRNRSRGGNGLGLSIVKKIIELHKGEIQVRSELGKGTEIMVTLWDSPR